MYITCSRPIEVAGCCAAKKRSNRLARDIGRMAKCINGRHQGVRHVVEHDGFIAAQRCDQPRQSAAERVAGQHDPASLSVERIVFGNRREKIECQPGLSCRLAGAGNPAGEYVGGALQRSGGEARIVRPPVGNHRGPVGDAVDAIDRVGDGVEAGGLGFHFDAGIFEIVCQRGCSDLNAAI